MRRAAALSGLLLAACASPYQADPPAASPPPATTVAVASPPPPIATPIPQPKDACGAAELQGLVGHPRTEIPVPLHPENQRVACTTCPVTQDFRPERLNFFFDAQSGAIRQIRCG